MKGLLEKEKRKKKVTRMQKDDAVDFSKMPCIYWSEETKISYLQRRIIVNSILYYEFDETIVPDMQYDKLVRQLVRMQKETSKEILRKTTYHYVFYDFDGSTGFYLYERLNKPDKVCLRQIALDVLGRYREENEK